MTDNRIVTSSIKKLLEDVTMPGKYVELMHMYGISAAFGLCFQSYVPPSAAVGLGSSPYTVVVAGRGVRRTSTPAFTLMWTTSHLPGPKQALLPNHVVLLASKPREDDSEVMLNDSSDTDDYDNNVLSASEEERSSVQLEADTCPDEDDENEQRNDNPVFFKPMGKDFMSTEETVRVLQCPEAGILFII
jgi:hypothetical protein